MNPKIYLSCLVFIIGSLLWAASAEQDFESDQQSKADDAASLNEEKDQQPLEDGAPPQGGWLSKFLRDLSLKLGIAIGNEGLKKAPGSKD